MYNVRRTKESEEPELHPCSLHKVAILKVFGHNLVQIYTNHGKSLNPLSLRKDELGLRK